ncbi:sulfatase-like hydrolase/transferase [bacterium]|nr:sulfatase-like hydrolase/transferase [bacterium]
MTIPALPGTPSLALSASFFLIGVFFTVKNRGRSFFPLLFSCASLLYLLLTLVYIVSDSFTADGINDAVLYHVQYGLAGAGFSEYSGLILSSILFGTLGVLFVTWTWRRMMSTGGKTRTGYLWISLLFLLLAFHAHPATGDILHLISRSPESHDFQRYYRTPYAIEKEKKRPNLVFIYAESLERTYFNEDIFPGLIKDLRDLEDRSTYFTQIEEVYGAGWTIAGMVASQCGIPLVTPSHGNSMSGMDAFLPNAVCMSDLLGRKGYRLAYYGGADLGFAGKGKFYSTHQFGEIMGRHELRPTLPETYSESSWGLYDDTLMDIAFERFTELSEAGTPFGLFLLTLDTHHSHGDPSGSCDGTEYQDGSNAILNAVACSDYLISEFATRINRSQYGGNTVIVIASDHLSMRNTAYDVLAKARRTNLFMIVDPASSTSEEITQRGSALDMGATILPFLGLKGSLGLGRDLRGSEESLVSELAPLEDRLRSWQEDIRTFWAFPRIRKPIVIHVEDNEIQIEGRAFTFPILVELNEGLETTLKFQFSFSSNRERLSNHVRELDEGIPFLWIDRCGAMAEFDPQLYGNAPCLIMARSGNRPTRITRIRGRMEIQASEVRALVSGS